jgi:probable phosphoglycerate mutase
LVGGVSGIIWLVWTRLLFVRHGESVHSVEGLVGGPRGCRGLTRLGHEQASRLGQRLAADLGCDVPMSVYSSALRRSIETAAVIAAAVGVTPIEDCRLCTWHVPGYADGQRVAEFQSRHAVAGGGVFRPFERDNETWAEMVVRTSRAIVDITDRHRGTTVIIAAHAETVEISFHALGMLALYRSFDLRVAPASITEWTTDQDPTGWPPPRWTLVRFNAIP